MQIPLMKGRIFSDYDKHKSPAVAIINENMAKTYFPDSDPIGKRIKLVDKQTQVFWREIVGVVGNARQSGPDAEPEVYVPYSQNPRLSMSLLVRTSDEPSQNVIAVSNAISGNNKGLSIYDAVPLEKLIASWASRRKF